MLIVDKNGIIIAILLGRPKGEDWDKVVKDVGDIMERVRRRGEKNGVFTAEDAKHRHGVFARMNAGVSLGIGQKVRRNIPSGNNLGLTIHFTLAAPWYDSKHKRASSSDRATVREQERPSHDRIPIQ